MNFDHTTAFRSPTWASKHEAMIGQEMLAAARRAKHWPSQPTYRDGGTKGEGAMRDVRPALSDEWQTAREIADASRRSMSAVCECLRLMSASGEAERIMGKPPGHSKPVWHYRRAQG